jgi:hypothetical protein
MPSLEHQKLTRLLVENPELLLDLVRRNEGIRFPGELELIPGPETVRALGSERIADGSVLLRHRGTGGLETIVVEVQLRKDREKRKAWAIYVAGTWARLGGAVMLVIVATSRRVARWAATPIDLGHGLAVIRPLVIGPDHIAAEMSLDDGRAWPERLALSVLVHGDKTGSLQLARTAVTIARELLALDDHRSMVLADLLVRFLNERVRRIVEAEMKIEPEVYCTEWGKAYGRMRAQALAEGHSAGMVEGHSAGLAQAVLAVLECRGLAPTKAQRERIDGCRSPVQLQEWLARARVAETVVEVFRK